MSQQSSNSKSNRHSNQFRPPPPRALFVRDLLTKRVEKVWDENGLFCCLIPTGIGVATNAAGYKRVCYEGKRVTCHVLVHEALHQDDATAAASDENLEISHLCGQPGCCNPQHLTKEDRKANIARRGCIGLVLIEGTDSWINACRHNPPCCVSSIRPRQRTAPAPEVLRSFASDL